MIIKEDDKEDKKWEQAPEEENLSKGDPTGKGKDGEPSGEIFREGSKKSDRGAG